MLWGRVIVLGVALLLVFLLGRATGGASGSEVEALQERVESLQAQNSQLEAAARSRATAPPPPPPAAEGADEGADETPDTAGSPAAPGTEASPSPSPEADSSSQTLPAEYTVELGENFSTISRDFYGSASFARCIMQANEYETATSLQAGDELTIPEKPANPCD